MNPSKAHEKKPQKMETEFSQGCFHRLKKRIYSVKMLKRTQ